MKQNQLFRIAVVGVLWLCVGAGCQKDPPNPNLAVSCRDGTCCGFTKGIHYLYAESYENELVAIDFNSGVIGFSHPIPRGTKETWKVAGQLCDQGRDKALSWFKQSGLADTTFRFRVWGRLYIGNEMPILADFGSPRFFAVDRIEAAK